MRVVLDTSILFRANLLLLLAEEPNRVVLPAVAYAERVRQLIKQGRDPAEFDRWLEANLIEVEPMSPGQAVRFLAALTDDAAWSRLARDAFIAGHLEADDVLWTTNPRDFKRIGVPAEQIALLPGS